LQTQVVGVRSSFKTIRVSYVNGILMPLDRVEFKEGEEFENINLLATFDDDSRRIPWIKVVP